MSAIHSLVNGALKLYQPDAGCGLRVNVDTILLAAFTKPKKTEKIIELGCAHGAISLILARRGFTDVRGIDIQPHLIEMARANAALNSLAVHFDVCNMREYKKISTAQTYDRVVVNPPYEEAGTCTKSPRDATSAALQGACCTLEDVISCAHYLLKNKGHLDIIMKGGRMADLVFLLEKYKMPAKILRCVHPKPTSDASVVLVEAVRSGNRGMCVEPPLYILDSNGKETEDLKNAYIIEEGQ